MILGGMLVDTVASNISSGNIADDGRNASNGFLSAKDAKAGLAPRVILVMIFRKIYPGLGRFFSSHHGPEIVYVSAITKVYNHESAFTPSKTARQLATPGSSRAHGRP